MNRPALAIRLVVALLLAAAIVWAFLNRDQLNLAQMDAWLSGFGIFGPIIYVLLFAIATVAFVPGTLFALAGGVMFGPVWGAILNLMGATLGASLSFLIARYLAGQWVSKKAGGRLKKLVDGVDAEGWKFVAFVRLVPFFPFNLSNYALGLTRIGFFPYVITSLICMAPGAIAFTWLGYAGREAAAGNTSAIRYGLFTLGLLAAIAVLPRLFARMKTTENNWIDADELRQNIASAKSSIIVDVRGPDEFNGPLGHIKGALNIPLAELPQRLTEINAGETQAVIMVCKTDKRSAQAASILEQAGHQRPRVLRGGMEAWNRSSVATDGNGDVK